MKIIGKSVLVLFSAIISLVTSTPFAQEKTTTQLQTELVSPWLVTVVGEARTRTLRITGAAPKPDGTLLLEATYGWTDGGQIAVSASASQSGQQSTLRFSTPADSRIAATQTTNGIFEGTFTDKKGGTKPIRIQKVSEEELQLKIATAKSARTGSIITKPAADVPAACASLVGQWSGTWSQGGIGQNWLWVVAIDANCTAKFAYLSHERPPKGFATAQIKDGALSFVCNSSTGGTCVFDRHGEELWARYSNSSGGTNSAVFTRLQ